MSDESVKTNLRAAVDEDHGGMLPARDQVVRFVQHAVEPEARLPCEAQDLRRCEVQRQTCGEKILSRNHDVQLQQVNADINRRILCEEQVPVPEGSIMLAQNSGSLCSGSPSVPLSL